MSDRFHISSCPVCNSDSFTSLFDTQDFLVTKETFTVVQCNNCTFRFTQDAPTEQEVGRYYDDVGYVEHSDTQSGLVFSLYHWGRKLMLNRKLKLIRRTQGGKTLLDVGSASGYFLNHMKESGYKVTGVEISEKARDLCKSKFNIDAYPTSFLQEATDQFDLITLWHVFEHVYTYNEYFESFSKLLSNDGRLVIAMPNYRSFDAKFYKKYWNAYDVPRHLWHFDYDSFKRFAQDRGFELEAIKPLPLDPVYNAMVSAEYKPSFTFLPWTVCVGIWSYLSSIFNTKKASSIVYVLKKTN